MLLKSVKICFKAIPVSHEKVFLSPAGMGTKRCQTRSAEKKWCHGVYKPETTQNLSFLTNIFISAVLCVCKRRRLMSNFKGDVVRGPEYFQPTGQGPGTSPDPQRCGVGQHRGFASPGSSPSPWEHPRPPRAAPTTGRYKQTGPQRWL